MCQHLVVVLHPILIVRPAVPILKNPPALDAFDGVVLVANHLLQLQPSIYLKATFLIVAVHGVQV